jgi:hypothetical protein
LLNPDVLEYKAEDPIAVLLAPVVILNKALFPAAKLCVPVAEELKFVVAPIEIFVETFPPPVLISKLLIVPFEPDVEIEPVTPKEPKISTVFTAKSPFINGVPEPEAIYNLSFSSVFVEGPDPNPIAILFEELPDKNFPEFCPNAILLDPIVLQHKVSYPIAILWDPDVLNDRVSDPNAVLLDPDVLLIKALFPIAILQSPITLVHKEEFPIAVLWDPNVLERKEEFPIDVLLYPVVF